MMIICQNKNCYQRVQINLGKLTDNIETDFMKMIINVHLFMFMMMMMIERREEKF